MKRYRIITAERSSGKTTYIKNLISGDRGAAGYISEKDCIGRYHLVSIRDKTDEILLTEEPVFPARFRKWYVNEEAFERALRRLSDPAFLRSSLYLDEVGLLECSGGGFAPLLCYAESHYSTITIAIRTQFVEQVIDCFSFLREAEIVQVPSWR